MWTSLSTNAFFTDVLGGLVDIFRLDQFEDRRKPNVPVASKTKIIHNLEVEGPVSKLSGCTFICSCGVWEMTVAAVGTYSHTTSEARMAQVKNAHDKHTRLAAKA